MARAYAGLKNTAKAVDAACGAVIAWGPTHKNRREALKTLEQVLGAAPDLDAYAAQLDKQSHDAGLDNPIVRKALGAVYADRQQYAKAVRQFRLASDLRPNDVETHQQLIGCYDAQGDKQGAIRQVLETLDLSPRAIELYKELGRRYGKLNQADETERAYTSIVEVLPSESESHAMLAEIRQEQNRWGEAIRHWRQAAQLRALEPTGLLKLAAAQIHEKQWDAAQDALRRLKARNWPSQFSNVEAEIRQLDREIEQGRNK
jgi:tetratricopeptide (TPR) repeat protein